MRRPLLMAGIAALGVAAASAQGRWLEKSHDFGVIPEEGGKVYCDFRLVNDGPEPLAIIDVRANCGCTRPEYSPAPVAPGDTAIIHVGFLPEGRPGQFVKRVSVDCDIEPLRSSLTISGTVVGSVATLRSRFPVEAGPARARASLINYGTIMRGQTKGQYLECINASADSLRPRLAGLPRYLTAVIEPAVVPPGERFTIATVLTSGETDAWGALEDSFDFYPDEGAEPLTVKTLVILAEDFSKLTPQQLRDAPVLKMSPEVIDLERLSRSAAPLTRAIRLTNAGRSPLIIRDVASSDPAVSLKLKDTKVKPGKSTTLEVKIVPSDLATRRLLNARITVIANDPADPTQTLRVVAELTD